VRYETFCKNPIGEIKRIADFAELPWTRQFERIVRDFHVESENTKWKKDLTPSQQDILNRSLMPYLIRYGYESAPPNRTESLTLA
jgi:hypothetical protein